MSLHTDVNQPGHNGDELATAFRDRFFCRTDAYALFLPTSTAPFKVDKPVTLDVITAHLTGARRIGAYSTAPGDSCVWGCADIDHTGHKKKLSYDERQSLYHLGFMIVAKARELGISAYLERSKRGGWHVWLFAESPIAAALMRRVLRALLAACGFPLPANASKTGPKDAIELFPMQDTIGSGYGNPVFLPYFGGDPLGMTVFVEPDHPELKAFPIVDFLAHVQPVPVARLAEVGEMARAQQSNHNGHATAHEPPPTDEDASLILARLSSKCQRFKDALAVQENGGLEEPDWFQWIHTLTTAGYAEAAHTFSQLSHKHDKRSASRLATCENAYTAGTAKPPIRCTTIGCDEEQITACFSGVVFRKEDGISNNPMVHVREEYHETHPNGAPPPPESDWSGFETDAREPETESTERPFIKITTDITAVVNEAEKAILALPHGPHLFQRVRRLWGIGRGVPTPKWLNRAPDAPTIAAMEQPALRELANTGATWGKYNRRSKKYEPALPPDWAIATLATRLSWKFPLLEGIICAPTLRGDGAIIDTPGYDPNTGLYLDTNGVAFPPIPEAATLDDAVAALALLDTIFLDFPFAKMHFQSAALAGVLTLAARHTIDGCTPLFAGRSTIRASGKGLMIDAISVISTGRIAPHWPQVLDEDEERKRLLTIALSGDACVHIDNVAKPLGSAPLDSAITAREISDRLLGKNKHAAVPFSAVLFASGNNMTFTGDMARRVIPIDLDPKCEKPEERTGFQHAPLLPWVQKNRPHFLVAALTVLKGYLNAGCPSQGVTALGSFEEWSHLIRQALIWAGKPDPCEGRKNIEAESDTGYEAYAGLLECWANCYPNEAVTLSRAIQDIGVRAVEVPSLIAPANEWNALREALSKFDARFDGKRLDSQRIGYGLRQIAGKVLENRRFIKDGEQKGVAKWKVDTL